MIIIEKQNEKWFRIKMKLPFLFKYNSKWQKQPPELCFKKSCSEKFPNIHTKSPLLESLINKVAGIQASNFIKNRLQHRCFSVKYAKFLRTSVLKNIFDQLHSILLT